MVVTAKCPDHVVDPSFQIGAGPTGGFDCTAHAASDAVDHATCGHTDPGGRTIRVLSNENPPDPRSPGLNLAQVADVLIEHYGVFLVLHIGSKALSWADYEANRTGGRGGLVQIGYGPIADSEFDAGRGFRKNHCVYEDNHSTEDPLADGRAKGVYDRKAHGPRVYDRPVMRDATEALELSPGHRAGKDNVWCAFTRDVAPEMAVTIKPRAGRPRRRFRSFEIEDGMIVGYRKRRTAGIPNRDCTIPRAFRWKRKVRNEKGELVPDTHLYFLVKITAGLHAGQWVAEHWSHER